MRYSLANHYKKLLTLAATLLLALPLEAQNTDGLYVLTNGRVRWQTGRGVNEVPIGIARGSWRDSIPESYTNHGAYTDTTLMTEIESQDKVYYLALDIGHHNNGTDDGIVATQEFTPYCVWLRTGNSGYYYQEWDNVRYFLLASSTQGLYLRSVAVGTSLTETTQWYDWDYGAAIQESYLRNGKWKNSYYWIMLDKSNKWRLSCDSYERPETIIYLPDGHGLDSAYCYDGTGTPLHLSVGNTTVDVYSTGNGAMYSPVDSTEYAKHIASVTPANKGLTGITLSPTLTAENPLTYGSSFTATATKDFTGGVTVNIKPAYTKYRVVTKLSGMNLDYRKRTDVGWGSRGDTTRKTYYYYNSTIYDDEPLGTDETLRESDITGYSYRLNNRAKRYLTLTGATSESCTVRCAVLPPVASRVDTLYLTVSYSNGTSQTVYAPIPVTNHLATVDRTPTAAPAIYGAVFGGGRQADVTANTNITVHRCDTVGAVYGGNDISGSVGGNDGATITLGTANTDSTHRIRIGSVYGGGNGYYNYQYVSGESDTPLTEGPTMAATQFKGSVAPWGATDSAVIVAAGFTSAYIPTIKKSHITVATDYVVIDSLFGGAKNAYLTGYDGAVVQIDNVHGTVFAEFGGNNYGGNLGATTNTVTLNVSGTRTYSAHAGAQQGTAASGVENNYFHGFGRDFGIRYLYGGGNKVVAPTVAINVTGGMVDTLFAGGNSASVSATTCTVNTGNSKRIFTNSTARANNASHWVGGRANYNVRCLFGGNNQAAMDILPTLTLTSGGIGTVYGGGNAGNMTAASTAASSELAGIFTSTGTDSAGMAAPASLGTYLKVTSNNMKIDYLYGGCQLASVTNATFVRLQGGEIGTVFGGCNISGNVGGGTYVVLDSLLDGTKPTIWANVFAGANGDYHCNKNGVYVYGIQFADNAGNPFDPYDDYLRLNIPTHNNTNLLMNNGLVHGNVYGGACMADVGSEGSKHGAVHMTLKGGTVKHNVFGGGNMAYVWGLGYVLVKGKVTIEGSLYAGNDKVGRVESYDSYTDGGDRTGLNFVASDNSTPLNKDASSSLFSTYVLLQGTPRISSVYGSGNGAYNYRNPEADDYISICPSTGGDYTPIQSSTFIDINVDGGLIDTVFGGGNGVSVRANLTLLLNATNNVGRYVNYIFGGNNKDSMVTCVPDILLTKGRVRDVYGGGNAGSMHGSKEFKDLCNNTVENVSTHIQVTSPDAIIEGSLYGGCNRADVQHMAYIDIRNTEPDNGIANVYGGNNIGGKIYGNTRVDISGGKVGNLFGGSNGHYDYVEVGGDEYKVYPYRSTHVDAGEGANLIATASKPDVDSTTVNIFGGTIENVYGGGQLGDCRATYVMVNDNVCGTNGNATITGKLFGGGAGDYENLNNPRRGNVGFPTTASSTDTGSTHVHLYHAKELRSAQAYGGGRGGDVYNTYITAYNTWSEPFQAIYGGCWGSDVYGTANLTMNGTAAGTTAYNVFGGNDFTGNVYKCNLKINGGTYGNIYGAGNGDYASSLYTESTSAHDYSGANRLYVPNAEYVEVNFQAGTVDGNLYGGGKLGTTFSYLKNAAGHYVKLGATVNDTILVDIARNATADTNTSLSTAYADPTKYSYVLVNVHGGRFNKNIYAGGAGDKTQIVYGLKMLNMDGADTYVKESVYGGSENVDDGYGAPFYDRSGNYIKGECVNGDSTTLRPSSIINLASGTVMNNVYGAGYMGDVYGSVFVNIGVDAIANSPVWTNTYKGRANAYAAFQPGATRGYVAALTKGALALDASIYGGANWGTNTGSYNFDARGFYGGESRIFIDGNGYETDNDATSSLPQLIIVKSVIGSGTSANGGDVLNRIDIQNYGALGSDCNATRELHSIQRSDVLWLRNTGIRYIGDNDAVSAYPSQQYTINRVGTVNARGYNLMEVDALMTNIGTLNFYNDALASADDYTTATALRTIASGSGCPENICAKIRSAIDKSTKKYTAVMVNNGVNIDIIDEHGSYGLINGYAFLLAENGTNAIVAARAKTLYGGDVTDLSGNAINEAGQHRNDGGFMSECDTSNKYPTFTGGEYGWLVNWSAAGSGTPEYTYKNYYANYRVWSVGNGRRSRYAVILAHANPSKLIGLDKPVLLPDTIAEGSGHAGTGWTGFKYALAHAVLDLPASAQGNYYKLASSGIVLRDDNSVMDLADYAWNPVDTTQLKYYTETGEDKWWKVQEDSTLTPANYHLTGHWEKTHGDIQTTAEDIGLNPGTTFGLVMASGENFQKNNNGSFVDPENTPATWNNGATLITGNSNVSISEDFRSAKVGGNTANACPRMDLYLTYDTFFSTTMLGTVTFTLEEYAVINNTPTNVGTIDVVVTIATIIDKFIDQEYEVLAMDNEGRSNIFRRKAVLPATLEARDLYLENIAWYPTTPDGTFVGAENYGTFEKFYLTDNEATVLANANNTFALNFTPTDNVSSSVSSGEGWHDIENDAKNASLYDLTGKAESGRVKSINDANPTTPYSLINAIDTKGMKIGQLDGRGLAAINFDLIYDGLKQYPAISGKGYVGKAVMTFRSYKATEDKGSFTITINVKCRAHGDTIYLASANHLRMIYSNADSSIKKPFNISACTRTSQPTDWQNPRTNGVGKSPSKYVNNFTDAFNKSIYQEGDVICILDTVIIPPGQQLTIQGADYAAVPIIRYTGHHHEWPGEKAVYRGPMIVVKGGEVNHVKKTTSFSTRSIAIDGSSLGKRKNIKIVDGAWQVDTNYYPDTNAVYGPIIAISNNHGRKTTVSLEHNTSISNNWNIAGASAPSAQHGAISVTDSAILELTNSVTIENNLNVNHPIVNAAETTDVRIPRDGAVYVDHGILSLGESHKETAVTITDNYLYRPTVPAGENYRFWKSIYKEKEGGDSLMRYSFDADKAAIDTATRANVFLTRRGASQTDFMTDIQSDTIVFTTSVAEGTRIGITKWFPGITTRDTIKVVMQPSGNLGYINEVMTHHNFYSDDPRYDTLYSTGIDNKTIFLHRCATFKQQVADVAISSLLPIANVPTHDALYYGAITEATCPTGGDTVIFRVQGGFFPYIYTWSNSTLGELQRDTTPYANNIVMSAVRATRSVTPNYTMVNASIADTFFTPHTDMSHQTVQKDIDLTVVATDVAGCRQKKTINLALQKTETGLPKFTKTGTTDSYWIDGDSTHIATGDRNFKAIRVYPRVWADRTQGVISAKIAGDANDIIYLEDESSNHHDLEGLLFCEGDVIRLATMPTYGKNSRFIMWDFDPYYNSQVNYVVPSASDTVRAYYGPRKYWKDTITNVTLAKAAYDDNYYYTNRNGKSYVTTYNGDVHIYDEDGLAWFISVVNGYNGTQARSFFFNSVYLHGKDGGYDMKDYLWTPVGAMQHPFRGRFIGANKSASDSCVEAGASRVIIKNIIIDEPNVDYTGFFGFLDSAWVENIELQGALVRGAQYVGGLAASTRQTNIVNCAVADSSNKDKTATILTTHYASGGMVGKADQTTITGSETAAKYVGDAVYNGGVVGYGTATKVYNSGLCNISRMQSVYAGGVAGYLDDGPSNNPLTLSKDGGHNDGLSRVMNNYVYFTSQGNNQRAGGLVGYAKNTVIENNYVYGDIVGAATEGGVGAVLDAGSVATNNYYERSAAPRSVGQQRNTASSSRNITFSGEGNQVILGSSNYGINNLTRALNIWVRTKSEGFNTWRSDLEHHNDGYPLFGAPDMIPVNDSLLVTGCDSVEWDGQVYLFDDEVVTHVIDSVMMVDSTFTLHIRLNHASRETLTDTAVMGQPYSGHGFQLTARELTMLQLSAVAHGTTSIILTDTLQNAIGCDSIVTLMLTVRQNVGIVEATPANRIKVYPNPTTSHVTIEATEAMSHVELYDNQGRRVEDYNTRDNNNITIDVSRYPAGAYYLRVYTAGNVTIQKLIKK